MMRANEQRFYNFVDCLDVGKNEIEANKRLVFFSYQVNDATLIRCLFTTGKLITTHIVTVPKSANKIND